MVYHNNLIKVIIISNSSPGSTKRYRAEYHLWSVMDLCVPTPLMLTVIVKCFPGEIYLGCVMTSCVVLCTCILPVVYQVVICFFHFVGQWVMIRMVYFLLHLLCPITLICFSLMFID